MCNETAFLHDLSNDESACTLSLSDIVLKHIEITVPAVIVTCMLNQNSLIIFHTFSGVWSLLALGRIVIQYNRYSLEKALTLQVYIRSMFT